MTKPSRYLLSMFVFLWAVGALVFALYEPLQRVFLTNPVLNGAIIVVLCFGIGHVVGRVRELAPEVTWVERRKRAEASLIPDTPPIMLAPMAAMLGDRHRLSLSTASTSSLLDSVGARLEEAREFSRYLIGLLIFLGLLGTFWGLLDTVSSVSEVIKSLALTSGDVTKLFGDLQAGLRAPLSGMGTAFGSSLFGLSGSLVLGFLDLMAGQSQNRFYNELEEWLASITQLSAGDAEPGSPAFLRGMVEQTTDRLSNVAQALAAVEAGRVRLDASMTQVVDSLNTVAERFATLEPILQRLSQAAPGDASSETARAGLEHLRGIEQTLSQLVGVVQAQASMPAALPVAAAASLPDEQALAHLRSVDQAIGRLVSLTEAARTGGLDDAARRHLASIDAALQRLAALGAVAATAAPQPVAANDDGRVAAHLRNLDEATQRLVSLAEVMKPAAPDEAARQHLANIEAALGQMAANAPAAPARATAARGHADDRALAHLHNLDQAMQHLVALAEAARPAAIDDRAQQHLANIDAALQQIANRPQIAPVLADAVNQAVADDRALVHLQNLDQSIRHLVTLTEAATPAGIDDQARQHLANIDAALQQLANRPQVSPVATEAAPQAAASQGETGDRALIHLHNLDQAVRHLVTLTEHAEPGRADAVTQGHLASIDAALQHLVAVATATPSAGNGAATAMDGAAIAHLASIEQHLQHLAREAGQLQYRVAEGVREELRGLAQSFAAMAEPPPADPEP